MKLSKTYFLILSALVLVFTSCDNFIDITQEDVVEQKENIQDYQTLNSSVLAVYSLLADMTEQLFVIGELRGDLTVVNSNANSYLREFYDNKYSIGNPYVSPKGFYAIINNTNRLLMETDKAIHTGIIDSLDYNSLHAELVGLRSWTYFQILKNYGSCKYFTTPLEYPAKKVQVLAYDEALDKILEDVVAVDSMAYWEFADGAPSNWNRIRVLKQTINTLIGEIYLEKQDYEKAAEKFEEVIRKTDKFKSSSEVADDPNFKLQTYKTSDWFKIFMGSSSNSEGLFWIFAGKEYNQFNELQSWTATATRGGSYVVKPSEVAVKNFQNSNDVYRGLYASYGIDGTQFYINKYITARNPHDNDAQFFLYRAGRLHLLWAECLNRLGQREKALEVINNGTHLGDGIYTGGVRGRVELPPITIPLEVRDKMLWLENWLITELALETAFEGNRWYDLVRIAKRRDNPDWLATLVLEKYPEEERANYQANFTSASWYLPVFE